MSVSAKGVQPVPPAIYDTRRLQAVHATGLLDTAAEEPFDRLARLASTLLEAPLAFVTIVDERRSFWKSCVGVETTDPAKRQNAVHESFCQYVIGTSAPLVVGDVAADPRTAANPSIATMGVAAWAGYPVHAPTGEVLGTFCVVDTEVREWTERDTQVLETLAHAASGEIALRAAVEEAQEASLASLEYGEANAELAHILQQSLLPPSLPAIDGLDVGSRYQPGGGGVQVLGDFYDVFPLSGRNWAVVVGDVCGHGPEAAAATARARYVVRGLATREDSPQRVLEGLNRALLDGDDEPRFVTAVLAILSPRVGGRFAVTLSSAGHTPSLLVRSDGTVTDVGAEGMLLGCFPDPPLTDVSFELMHGESLVMYTDGVTEARRGDEQFEERRLRQVLSTHSTHSAEAMARSVQDAVLEHSEGQLSDDTAVVVVKVPSGTGA